MVARRGVYNAVSVDAKDSFGNPTEMDMKLLDMVVVKVCYWTVAPWSKY